MNRSDISQVFDFFPIERIQANSLQTGDIAKIHSRWVLIISGKIHEDEGSYNNGWNYECQVLGGGCNFLPPDLIVSIVKRDLLDLPALSAFIAEVLKEEEELRISDEEEEKERAAEEAYHLRKRLEELGEL